MHRELKDGMAAGFIVRVRLVRRLYASAVFAVPLLLCFLCAPELRAAVAERHVVEDMAGRRIAIPQKIARVATLGSTPAINAFVFAVGKGGTIVNGLPTFSRGSYWKYQMILSPGIEECPAVQESGGSPNTETLFRIRPDVVFTTQLIHVDQLEKRGFRTIYIDWQRYDPENLMNLMGKIFDRQGKCEEYADLLKGGLRMIETRLRDVPEAARQKALFCKLPLFAVPSRSARWVITRAGGTAVSEGLLNKTAGAGTTISLERLLLWNPDILIVWSKEDVKRAYADSRLAPLSAIRHRRVYAVPVGATPWFAPSPEQYLGLIWAAKLFYPDRFRDIDLVKETRDFYRKFYEHNLSVKDAEEMIDGRHDR